MSSKHDMEMFLIVALLEKIRPVFNVHQVETRSDFSNNKLQ